MSVLLTLFFSALVRTHDGALTVDPLKEAKAFSDTGFCNKWHFDLMTCAAGYESTLPSRNPHVLLNSSCFCDKDCNLYGDCCIDAVGAYKDVEIAMTCRDIFTHRGKMHVNVQQQCSSSWADEEIREFCEQESTELEQQGLPFTHLQDIPVRVGSKLYRNVFCALCNYEEQKPEPMAAEMRCFGNVTEEDLVGATYSPKKRWFEEGHCRWVYEEPDDDVRFCKPFVSTCLNASEKCDFGYASYVYSGKTAYKNFRCALCNGVDPAKTRCHDPRWPPFFSAGGIRLLFDFDFGANKNCRLADGRLWDPLLKRCLKLACGLESCPESYCSLVVLEPDTFVILPDARLYVTGSDRTYTDYELKPNGEALVCADLPTDLVSEITTGISMVFLALHLVVYGLLSALRNGPGKVLMALSGSLLVGHLSLLSSPRLPAGWSCYLFALIIYVGYLSAFSWMTLMAWDIHNTFSRHTITRRRHRFLWYAMIAWGVPLVLVACTVAVDLLAPKDGLLRPRYGTPLCWFNGRWAQLAFFVIPAAVSLLVNAGLFIATTLMLHRAARDSKPAGGRLTDRGSRYVLYAKLGSVFGIGWLLGFLAVPLGIDWLWYVFVATNGLQGTFVFAAFAMKRSVLRMLTAKFGIPGRTYRLKGMSTLQTTISEEGLRAVRKIDPEQHIPSPPTANGVFAIRA